MSHLSVIIVGSGFAGLGMAFRLRERGITDITILERGDSVGGTWRDNTYPGAACDIPSHLYSFSWHPKADWSCAYARQPEIRAYLEEVAAAHDLHALCEFHTEMDQAEFDERTATWTITSTDGRRFSADVFVSAVGGLKDPALPDVEGLHRFAGPMFHSSRWDHDVDLAGKRVGVIGTGASAIQFVPAIADDVAAMTVFQRTPPWVKPRADFTYPAIVKAAFAGVPRLRAGYRALQFILKEAVHPLVFARETPVSRAVQSSLARLIRAQIDDPELAAALTPDYRLGCKRVLISSDWYPTLNRPHVDVETRGIARITETGVVLADEASRDFDVLILGTGFTVDRPLGDAEVIGVDGQRLTQAWGARPSAHLGITVAGFPNAFLLLGPNTALGHNSVVLMIEAQVDYVVQALERLDDAGRGATLEVRAERCAAFVDEMDGRSAGTAWAAGCRSWYLGPDGTNFTVWPGTVRQYQRRVRRFDSESYSLSSTACLTS